MPKQERVKLGSFISEKVDTKIQFEGININGTENIYMAADLQLLNEAGNYRHMLYSHVQNVLGKRIVEIGSGIGNYTEMLLLHGNVWATDIDEEYVQFLSKRFAGRDGVKVGSFQFGNLTAEDRREILDFAPDTFVCMNVLEHIQDDALALSEMTSCLSVGGYIAVIVPAMPALFSNLDRKYGHFRRYTKHSVRDMVSKIENAELVHCQYFNFPGIIGWWFNHVLLNREALPKGQTFMYDKFIVPLVNYFEKIFIPPAGLSIVFWIRRIK